MDSIDADLLARVPLDEVEGVTFYKRDEVTSDHICCEVVVAGDTWTFHEEMDGWRLLIEHLEKLPGFRDDWVAAVSQPPFAPSNTLAFRRS